MILHPHLIIRDNSYANLKEFQSFLTLILEFLQLHFQSAGIAVAMFWEDRNNQAMAGNRNSTNNTIQMHKSLFARSTAVAKNRGAPKQRAKLLLWGALLPPLTNQQTYCIISVLTQIVHLIRMSYARTQRRFIKKKGETP